MNKYNKLLFLLIALLSCQNRTSSTVDNRAEGDKPYMYFKEEVFDAGKINEGGKIEHTFYVENRGKADLVLKDVRPSCGCTVAKYDNKPIPFGKSTPIVVVFDSHGKLGTQSKKITVTSNAMPETKDLTLRCEVIPNNNSKTE